MLNLFNLNPVYCDAPEPWQIGFQDGASPTFEGITELHDSIFFYLIVIFVGVAWVIGSVVVNFSSDKSPIVYKYANHGFDHVLQATISILVATYLVLMFQVWYEYASHSMMAVLPIIFSNLKGKRSVIGIKGKALDITNSLQETVDITPTPKMLRAMTTLKSELEGLKYKDNTTVYDWLMSQSDIQELVNDKLHPVTFNTLDGNLIAENCVKGAKPSSYNAAGVYIFFNIKDNECYVGSAMSLYLRFVQHLNFSNKHRRYVNNALAIPKLAAGKLYSYAYGLEKGLYGMHWGVLSTVQSYTQVFQSANPYHNLTLDELNVLDKFTNFFVRLHEHVLIDAVGPSINVDPVKFTVNWSERSDTTVKSYEVIDFNTGNVLVTSPSKKRLVSITGKSLNQVSDFLDHEKALYSNLLGAKVILRTAGVDMPIKTGAVQTSWVTKDPILGFDVLSLKDGQIHLLDMNKQLTELSFPSSTAAAWELDGKTTKLYIHRYVNVDRPVETSKGTFYFVQNTSLERTLNSPFGDNVVFKPNAGTAGKRSYIVIHDLVLDVYVEFNSKNSLGMFLWGKSKTGGGIFDRYLYNEVIFKDRLRMYFKSALPTDVPIISSTKYFELIGSNKYPF